MADDEEHITLIFCTVMKLEVRIRELFAIKFQRVDTHAVGETNSLAQGCCLVLEHFAEREVTVKGP